MKNVTHPNMFPSGGSAAPDSGEQTIATDADVAGISAAPATASAWANPMLGKLRQQSEPQRAVEPEPELAPVVEARHGTRVEQAIAFLTTHGAATGTELCVALGLHPSAGIHPYIKSALDKGAIVRVDRKYSLPGATSPATAIESKPADPVAKAPRKPAKVDPPAPASPPVTASVPPAPEVNPGRKPLLVLFVGELQLFAWSGGGITIQTEDAAVELEPAQTRALLVLAELHT